MEHHREVSERDNDSADQHGDPGACEMVSNPSARQRCQVNSHCVPTVNRRSLFGIEPEASLCGRRRHIEDENGAHAVIAEPFPKLREEERSEALRVSGKTGCVGGSGFDYVLFSHMLFGISTDCAAIYPVKLQRSKD